jgi:hypothetical protein
MEKGMTSTGGPSSMECNYLAIVAYVAPYKGVRGGGCLTIVYVGGGIKGVGPW